MCGVEFEFRITRNNYVVNRNIWPIKLKASFWNGVIEEVKSE